MTKVLFVCSGNTTGKPGIIILNQGESLKKYGLSIEYFTIIGKGLKGYLYNILILENYLRVHKYDLVHAHYGSSAFVASIATRKPLVVSLMGSDIYMSGLWATAARIFYKLRWDATIVKSEGMKEKLKMDKALVIPNGVDLDKFKPFPRKTARKHIGYSCTKRLIIFVSDPSRKEKNYELAQSAVDHLGRTDVELKPVYNVPSEEIPFYMNAADVLLLTSEWEGSVNVVKEAMACNLPIVSTDVGDVKENTLDVDGCFVCEGNTASVAEGLEKALQMRSHTNGREKIINLKLDSESVAKRIIAVYEGVAGIN